MTTDLLHPAWGTVTSRFWQSAAGSASAQPITAPAPGVAEHQPSTAPPTAEADAAAPARPPSAEAEAELPPPSPGTQYVPKAPSAPVNMRDSGPGPEESEAMAAWRRQAVTMAERFLEQATANKAATQVARWARIRRELAEGAPPWGAATELWLATGAQLLQSRAPVEQVAVVLRDAHAYWSGLDDDSRRRRQLSSWLLHLLRQVAVLADLADTTERWINATTREG